MKTPMDPSARRYLIAAHNKVLAHCRQALKATALEQRERERIQRLSAFVELELTAIDSQSDGYFKRLERGEKRKSSQGQK